MPTTSSTALCGSITQRLKTRLNRWHALALQTDGVQGRRGSLRDAATVFDENGAVLQAPKALVEALAGRDWRRLFITLRPLWKDAKLPLVGHALLEKLLQPRKPHCAHVLLAEPQDAAELAAKPFLPLPVLGRSRLVCGERVGELLRRCSGIRGRRPLQTG